jgi:hypothetical protein
MSRLLPTLWLALCLTQILAAQTPAPAQPPALPPPGANTWTTKTFDLKYINPELIRNVFSSQSYVMDADRDLKLLTARGSAAFLKQVEDTIKRLDVPPPIPPNTQITVYLLATAPQAPGGVALPPELKALAKELPAKMADMEMLRLRVGQTGETVAGAEPPPAPSVSLTRILVDSAAVNPGPKGDIISLNGLKIWVNNPPADPNAPAAKTPKTEPDVAANIDLTPNQAAIVAKIGVEKPIALVVRASIVP